MLYQTETEHPNEVIFNENVHESPVYIFKPDGTLLGVTDNELVFNDFRLQVKRKKLDGYTISMDGGLTKTEVDNTGHIKKWPDNLFNIVEYQLDELIFDDDD